MEELWTELRQLRDLVEATPRLHRKDVARLLGVSSATLSRRMKRRDFPRPIYDAGRPKWLPGQFAGHANGHDAGQANGQPVSG